MPAIFGKPWTVIPLTIANGQAYTNWVHVGIYHFFAIGFPATLTGTGLTVETSADGTGDDAKVVNGLSITKQNSEVVPLTTDALHRGFLPLGWIRFKSSGNEGATRTLQLHCKQ